MYRGAVRHYIHDDALGAANVISNASGTVAEVVLYLCGHEFDAETGRDRVDLWPARGGGSSWCR